MANVTDCYPNLFHNVVSTGLSAISANVPHPRYDGIKVGQHDLTKMS